MSDHFVSVRSADRITTITLDRPEKRNALSIEMMAAITAAFREVGDSDALGVVLAATGPVFSAGHNFGDMHGADLHEIRAVFNACTEMMDTIQAIPQPVVARVHALATAAGCQLVATCDLAVAARSASFAIPGGKGGLFCHTPLVAVARVHALATAAGCQLVATCDLAVAARSASFAIPGGKGGLFCHTPLVAVARNVGRKRALELAMTGDPIDAETAADWGLVNRVVDDADLDDATLDLVGRATRGSSGSKALGKHGFYAQIDLDQDKAYAYAIELMSAAATTPDAQEGMAAFLQKRAPVFRGR